MIPLRILLRALAYVVEGRGQWLSRKAADNRKAAADDSRGPGRLAAAQKLKAQAGAVGRLSHTHERGVVMLDAALAGQILAYATGHLEGMPELRRLAAEAAPDVRRTLEELVEIGVLPWLKPKESP